MSDTDLSGFIHQTILVLRPCDCEGCTPKEPIERRRADGSTWMYTPPSGKVWTCTRLAERAEGLPAYQVVDLDGYLPPDLASKPGDAAPWKLWPACGCCGLSEPQLDWIRDHHPGMILAPWAEPKIPEKASA